MRKTKFKKFLAITMAAMVTLSTNAFATPITLTDSTADASKTDTLDKTNGTDYFADETTNVWQNGEINEEVRVTVDRASRFEITIPKEIVLNGNDGSANYSVSATGEIAGDQIISVVPDTSFKLNEDGGKQVDVTVTQDDTDFTYVQLDANTPYSGSLSAPDISAGNWNGSFYFNIEFKDVSHTHNYTSTVTKEATCTETGIKTYTCECNDSYTEQIAIDPTNHDYNEGVVTKEPTFTETGVKTYTCSRCGNTYTEEIPVKEKTFNDYSWAEIAAISETGNAASTFSIGDEKELTIGSETYHVQILGFDHDDKSDGSGKAGITVGLKEMMTTKKAMNSSESNIGGWETSEMRTYLQNDVYNALPDDVKAVIKTVNKVSDAGNEDTTTLKTTQDKLFLFSTTEVGLNPSYNVDDQGTKYEYFTDLSGNSGSWWLRSAYTNNSYSFYDVSSGGNYYNDYADDTYGVVFGFSI